MSELDYAAIAEGVGRVIELGGLGVIVTGAVGTTLLFLRRLVQQTGFPAAYRSYRQGLGRAILLGLEFLIAADIIRTVAISPTLESVAILAAIVLIRTFLSFTLQVEIEGRWPWESPVRARRPERPELGSDAG